MHGMWTRACGTSFSIFLSFLIHDLAIFISSAVFSLLSHLVCCSLTEACKLLVSTVIKLHQITSELLTTCIRLMVLCYGCCFSNKLVMINDTNNHENINEWWADPVLTAMQWHI